MKYKDLIFLILGLGVLFAGFELYSNGVTENLCNKANMNYHPTFTGGECEESITQLTGVAGKISCTRKENYCTDEAGRHYKIDQNGWLTL